MTDIKITLDIIALAKITRYFEFYTRPCEYQIGNVNLNSEIDICPPGRNGQIPNNDELKYCEEFLSKLATFNVYKGNKFITATFIEKVPLNHIITLMFYFGVGFLMKELKGLVQQDFELYYEIIPIVIGMAGLNHPISKRFVDFTKKNVIIPMSFYDRSIEFFENINKRLITKSFRSDLRRQKYLNRVLVFQTCSLCKIEEIIKYFEFGLTFIKSMCCQSTVHIGVCKTLCFRNSICRICNKHFRSEFNYESRNVVSNRAKLIRQNLFIDRSRYKGMNMFKFAYPSLNYHNKIERN